jgi:hypothetical protein
MHCITNMINSMSNMSPAPRSYTFGPNERAAYLETMEFFLTNFQSYSSPTNTVGYAAFSIGEVLSEALSITNPRFLGAIARQLYEAACIIMSPGFKSLSDLTDNNRLITTNVHTLVKLFNKAGHDRHDFDLARPRLERLRVFGNIGSHHGAAVIDKATQAEVMVLMNQVANDAKHRLFTQRAMLGLDNGVCFPVTLPEGAGATCAHGCAHAYCFSCFFACINSHVLAEHEPAFGEQQVRARSQR